MTKFESISLVTAAIVVALDAYFVVQLVNVIDPYSLHDVSSRTEKILHLAPARGILAAGICIGAISFKICYRNLSTNWRVVTFLPVGAGIGLLLLSRFVIFW